MHLDLNHSAALSHHLSQARAWLSLSASDQNTAPLSYAALELRYAIERIAAHYLASMVVGTQDESELLNIGNFDKIQARIYELAGNQLQIDRGFEFARLLSELLGLEIPKAQPKIGSLRKHWHTCSQVCHIGWALVSMHGSVAADTFKELDQAHGEISAMVDGYNSLPRLDSDRMHPLQSEYISGKITDEDVIAFVKREGLRAEYTPPGAGVAKPVGTSIPPQQQ